MRNFDHYYDPPDPPPYYRELSNRIVVARKDHTCSICKKPISKGERYRKIAFLHEDGFGYSTDHIRHSWDGDYDYSDEAQT